MTHLAKPVRMSTKGQVVIPLDVRRRLGIRAGDRLVVVAGDREAVLMTAARYVETLRGAGRGVYGKTAADVDRYIRRERGTWPK